MRKITILLLSLSLITCKKEDTLVNSQPTSPSLVQQLEAYPVLSQFTDAIAACDDTLNANLNELTLIAPTNAVLNGFLSDAGAANFSELKEIIGTTFYRAWLGSHFFPSALRLDQMQTAYIPSLAYNPLGQQIHSFSQREKNILAINGQYLNLVSKDLRIASGMLHISSQKLQVPTITKLISANGTSFSILKRALQISNNSLASMLNREDQMFTIFAPNDAAFDRFFQDQECNDLDGYVELFGSAALEDLLRKHISKGSYNISSLNGQSISSLDDVNDLSISLEAGSLKVSNSSGAEAHIIHTDITAFNGRIQLIDEVLKLP